jgi:hypothetical protein
MYATQGGGTAVWDRYRQDFVWFEIPDWMVAEGAKPGDPLPDEWGVSLIDRRTP